MITKEQLILIIAKAYELPPNLVESEIAAMAKNLPGDHPGLDCLIEQTQQPGYEEMWAQLIGALQTWFYGLRVGRLIHESSVLLAKGTHMSAEQVEAFLLPSKNETPEELQAQAEAFVRNLVFAAMNKSGKIIKRKEEGS